MQTMGKSSNVAKGSRLVGLALVIWVFKILAWDSEMPVG